MFYKNYDTLMVFVKSIKGVRYVSLEGVVFYVYTSCEIDFMEKCPMCYLTDRIVLLKTWNYGRDEMGPMC